MFVLELMTKDLLKSTYENWDEILSVSDLPFSPVGYESLLSYCNEILEKPANHKDALLYVVRKNNEDFASGIFIATLALPNTPNAYMKILESRTSPKLDSRWGNDYATPFTERLALISQVLVTGFYDLYQTSITENNCTKLKIFGNKQADRDLFMRLVETINNGPETGPNSGDDITVDLEAHGSWIVLTTKQSS
jgi:hypothetical protein